MDFSLDPEVVALQRSVAAFAARHFAASTDGPDRDGFDRDGWDACADFGIQAVPVVERYGGLDKDFTTCAAVLQALARECHDGALLFALCCHIGAGTLLLQQFGSDAQKNLYLPGMAAGYLIAGHGIAGREAQAVKHAPALRAFRTDDGFRITGVERYVSNASVADIFVLCAALADEDGTADDPENGDVGDPHEFIVVIGRDTPGLSIGAAPATMGLGGSPIAPLTLDDCRVPASAVLGPIGGGRAILRARHRWFTGCLLACALGRMERQLGEALAYARQRQQFGAPIASFQTLSHKLADMKMRIELARLITYRLTWDDGPDAALYAAIGKLFVDTGYVASSRDAIQIHGGYGYMRESGIERDLRDALGFQTLGGVADVQRDIIAAILRGDEPDFLRL